MPLPLAEASPVAVPIQTRRPFSARIASLLAVQADIYGSDCDLQTAMRLIATKALTLTPATSAVIELQDGEDLVYRSAAGDAGPYLGLRVPIAGSLSGTAVCTGRVQRCDDSELDPRVNRAACRRVGSRSMVAAPLLRAGVVVGVLKVYSTRPNAFDDHDVTLLELAGTVLAAALARASESDAREALMREREAAAAEREQANRAIAESQALRAALIDGFPGMLAVVERLPDDLVFLTVNPAVAAFYRRSVAEVEGSTTAACGVPRETLTQVLAGVDRAVRERRSVTWEAARPTPEGPRSFEYTASPLPQRDAADTRCVIMLRDVTEAVQLRQRADLQERLAVAGRLAAGMAHEANNPLAFVLSNLDFLKQELARRRTLNETEWRELSLALDDAADGADRVRKIVKELYTFTAAPKDVRGPVNLVTIAERALTLTRSTLHPGAELDAHFAPVPLVEANEAQLAHVLVHLLMNASQAVAARKHGATPARIGVSTSVGRDGRVVLCVKDNGDGISAEVLPRIFDPFFTTRGIGRGLGLGLSVALNVVRAHGGDILVDTSALGTEMRVVLPAFA